MAKTKEILVHGQLTQVIEYDHSAQEIDDAVLKANNAVNRAGDTMAGDLTMSGGKNVITKDSYGAGLTKFFTYNNIGYIQNEDGSGKRRALQIFPQSKNDLANALKLETNESGSSKLYNIIHTGNKPYGSYTGHGGSPTRTIETGGIGGLIYVYSGAVFAIIGYRGGIGCRQDTGAIEPIPEGAARFYNGGLRLGNNGAGNIYANGETGTYYYWVV